MPISGPPWVVSLASRIDRTVTLPTLADLQALATAAQLDTTISYAVGQARYRALSASTYAVESAAPFDLAQPADIDWLNFTSSGVWSLRAVPSPYSPAHVLHPSVVLFNSGWRGYRYWMAYTPYPDSNPDLENPCIAGSNDNQTWTAIGPAPIVPKPTPPAARNSDTDIAYDAANDRLLMVWRSNDGPAGANQIKMIASSDGVTWTQPVVVYVSANNGTSTSTDLASPSLIWNASLSRWEMFGNILRDTGSAWPLGRIRSASADPFSAWDQTPAEITITPPSGRKWWHSQVRRLSSGAYVGIAQDNPNTTGASGNLYLWYTPDGTTWSTKLLDDSGRNGLGTDAWYRPSFVLREVPGSGFVVDAYGSALTTSGIYQQTLFANALTRPQEQPTAIGAILNAASLGNAQNILMADSFNRGDSATTLGTSTNGVAWTNVATAPDVIGISSNRAYNVSNNNCRSIANFGAANYFARLTLVTRGQIWIIARWVDANNLIRVGISASGDALRLQVVTAGAVVVNVSAGVTPLNGDEIGVSVIGSEVVAYLNGQRRGRITTTQGLTSTTGGLQMSSSAGFVDNFVVTAVS